MARKKNAEVEILAESAPDPSVKQELFELRLTDDLSRTRRNLLFANSLLLLIGAANPPLVGLPGFGSASGQGGLAVDGSLAMAGVLGATLLFGWEYWLEYRLTRWRNNSIFGEYESKSIDDALTGYRQENQALISSIKIAERAVISQFVTFVESNSAPGPSDEPLPADYNEAVDEIATLIREANERSRTNSNEGRASMTIASNGLYELFHSRLDATKAEIRKAKEGWVGSIDALPKLKDVTEKAIEHIEALNRDIEQLHKRIHRFQGNAFVLKDLVMPAAFFGAGLGLALWRFYERWQVGFAKPHIGAWIAGVTGALVVALFTWRFVRDHFWPHRRSKRS